jgi:hypothetical protein
LRTGIPAVHNIVLPEDATKRKNNFMLEQEDVRDLVLDLEQRIDKMQSMGDSELGTFTRLDWIVLIVFAIVIPVIAMELVR